MKGAENARIKRVVRRLGCYERLLREMLAKKVTKETIEAHGKFDELKASVDDSKATEFFAVVELQNFRQSRLAMLVDAYLRYFLLSGGRIHILRMNLTGSIRRKSKRYLWTPTAIRSRWELC